MIELETQLQNIGQVILEDEDIDFSPTLNLSIIKGYS